MLIAFCRCFRLTDQFFDLTGNNSGHQPLDSDRIMEKDFANYSKRLNENGNGMHEVGQKRANGLGLFDMLGNVWERVNDWYDAHYYQNSASQDPSGPTSGRLRVVRGGSWWFNSKKVRVSDRSLASPLEIRPGTRTDF